MRHGGEAQTSVLNVPNSFVVCRAVWYVHRLRRPRVAIHTDLETGAAKNFTTRTNQLSARSGKRKSCWSNLSRPGTGHVTNRRPRVKPVKTQIDYQLILSSTSLCLASSNRSGWRRFRPLVLHLPQISYEISHREEIPGRSLPHQPPLLSPSAPRFPTLAMHLVIVLPLGGGIRDGKRLTLQSGWP